MAGNRGTIVSLEDSYSRCVAVTKARAKNFHFAFRVLPKDRYRGICALYAFARLADDYSDDESDPAKAIASARRWREALDKALDGDAGADPVLPAVVDTMRKYEVPAEYLHELMTGTEMDATVRRYATWDETYRYCYRVASVVGMMTIRVFGIQGSVTQAMALAERVGIGFQMTNILRDLKEDAGRDRLYLPLEDLARFGLAEKDLLACRDSRALRELVRFEVERTRTYYEAAGTLVPMIEARSRPALDALVAIYRRLLEEIERREYDVLTKRVTLSTMEKMRLAGGSAWKSLLKT